MIARVSGCGVAMGKVVVAQEKGWLLRLCKVMLLRYDKTLRILVQYLPYVPVMKLALVGEQNLKT